MTYNHMSNEELLTEYLTQRQARECAERSLWEISNEWRERAARDGASEIAVKGTHVVELKQTATYDQNKLLSIKEFIDPAELESSGAWRPPQTIPGKFDVRKLMKFRKRHKDISTLLDNARIPGNINVSIREVSPNA